MKKKKFLVWIFWFLVFIIIIYNPLSARLMTLAVAAAHDLDGELFYRLIDAESSFRSLAYSRNKAIGLGQVQDKTAQYIYPHYVSGMLWFPPTNLHISAIYFKYLLKKYRGNISFALAAYNWGEANVDRKIREEGVMINPETNYRYLFRNVPETYFFIRNVIE